MECFLLISARIRHDRHEIGNETCSAVELLEHSEQRDIRPTNALVPREFSRGKIQHRHEMPGRWISTERALTYPHQTLWLDIKGDASDAVSSTANDLGFGRQVDHNNRHV
jgi:hypothetical protein